jgi:molybdopterin biosynthesis enzyme
MGMTIELTEALRRVLGAPCGRSRTETVELPQARTRFLAEAIAAEGPWPATDRSAMDGFAVAAGEGLSSGARLSVVGQSLAGRPFDQTLMPGCAVRIMTGAVVPAGADAVVPVEQTSGFASDPVELTAAVQKGQNIRPMGSEAKAGQLVLRPGTRIRAAEIGVLAALGHAKVKVHARPRVAIVATGDEVIPVDCVPLPHQVRESNS